MWELQLLRSAVVHLACGRTRGPRSCLYFCRHSLPLPFLLSLFLQALFTAVGVQGTFTTILTSLARCLVGDATMQQLLKSYLTVLLRDEVVAFFQSPTLAGHASTGAAAGVRDASTLADGLSGAPTTAPTLKSSVSSSNVLGAAASVAVVDPSATPATIAATISEAVLTNVADVVKRVVELADVRAATSGGVLEVDRLVAAAVDPANISRMALTWHPWF